MLSLLLITALAVQYPAPASKPAQDTTAQRRPAATTRSAAPRDTTRAAPVSRVAFQNTMRELWTDHIVYTRGFIVSAAAGAGDTAVALQRLLRNQDEIGDAIKPYYGDAAGTQLATLLRSHIQLAGRALVAAKGSQHAMSASGNVTTTTSMQSDTTQIKNNAQYPTATGRATDTTRARAATPARTGVDTTKSRSNSQSPMTTARAGDTTKVRTSDSSSMQVNTWNTAQAQMADSQSLTAAIAALRANADSIATFLSTANARNWSRSTLQGGLQMHINLLLQEATAHIKGDWQGSVAAFDASLDQANQMADMLSEGIIKQFPTRFTNKATTMSSLQ
jgi:hypothetical protein